MTGNDELGHSDFNRHSGFGLRVCRSFLVLLSSLFSLFLLAGCPGEDITPPDVAIIAPADGDSIAGPTTIRARATDNRAVARVEFFVDSTEIGVVTSSAGDTFEYNWTPAGMLPGTTHALRCYAIDGAGNRGSSPPITVHISRAVGTHHSGTIGAPETWTVAASPHIVDSDLDVEALLTIEPGVTVGVADGATIAVGTHSPGGISAPGRTDSTITLTAINPAPGPGAWSGIEFRVNAATNGSILRHCVVEYAGGGGALVRCDAGRVDIDSCVFRASSGRGVSASGTGLRSLSHTAFSGCAGYPVSVALGLVSALGAGNTLTGNKRNAIELVGSTVTASDTWPNLGFPYAITATLTVADSSNPLLTVAPGCSLLFADSAALRVGVGQPGGLTADGTSGTIAFAALGPGNWRGIEFWEKTDPLHTALNFCRVGGAGAAGSAAITCYSVAVTIINTRIAGNAGSGVYTFSTGFARFENDTVTGCVGSPLHIAAQYVGTIGNGNSFAGNSEPAIQVIGGTITQNVRYQRQDVPYHVTGTVDVGSQYEPALTIESGVVLQFDPGTALTIGLAAPGQLLAVGVPDSITFTGATAEPGTWHGIELHRYASSSTQLKRCRLLYGGGADQGILFINGSVPTLDSNEIAFSSNYCVYLQNTILDPDTLRQSNWLHDWAPGFDDIFEGP